MIDDKMLDSMRDCIPDLLPSACDILNVVSTPSGNSYTYAYGTATARLSCRADLSANGVMTFSLPYDAAVSTQNIIQKDSILYSVEGVNNSISWQVVKRVQARQLLTDSMCILQTYAGTVNNYNETEPTWTAGGTITCDFRFVSGAENQREGLLVENYEATIRLPIETVVTDLDRLQMTVIQGQSVTPVYYGIVSPDDLRPDGHHFNLRRVDPSREAS